MFYVWLLVSWPSTIVVIIFSIVNANLIYSNAIFLFKLQKSLYLKKKLEKFTNNANFAI